ncbi:MAG: hypothetical protein J3Q66DRAFT_158795 [Benniella sp.]|nr:MAG: hypothetical protein J3Q66DRAFT_158795 [Benniella sp.]
MPKSLFQSEDTVDQFFFVQPILAWDDTPVFCTDMLQRKYTMSCRSAYLIFTKHTRKVDNKLQQHATSSRKHDPQEANERPPRPALHFGIGPNEINEHFRIKWWLSALQQFGYNLSITESILQAEYQSQLVLAALLDRATFRVKFQQRAIESLTNAASTYDRGPSEDNP